MCEASSVSPACAGIVPWSVGSLSRSHGTMCTTTLTLRACMSASTAFGSRLKTSGLKSNDGCLRVPAARREAGAEIDDRVERDLLRAERVDDPEHLRVVFERAVRLHVAERPLRRHDGRPGDRREVLQRRRRVVRVEDEEVVEPGHDPVDRRNSLAERLLLVPLGLRRALVAGRLPRQEHAALRRRADRPAPTGVATNRPQPPVPSSIATGLREPYMSLCQRGSIVSSAPRRSNCTALLAPVLALLRPRAALAHPEHRVLVERERQAAVALEDDLLHRAGRRHS